MRARTALLVSLIALVTAAAHAGEERGISKTVTRAALPGGLVLLVEPGSFAVERDGVRLPLNLLGRSTMPRALKGVDVESDGNHVIATITDSCDRDHALNLTVASLNAQLDDVAAARRAATQVKSGKPAEAAQTLAPLLARAPVATYTRVASDPELMPLLRRPELAALRAPARGAVKLALTKNGVTMIGKGKAPVVLAVSSRHRLVAAIDSERGAGGCAGEAQLLLLDLTGAEVARVPLYTASEMTTDEAHDCPFARPARAKIAARTAAAQRLLADLGFGAASGEAGAVSTTEPGAPRALFARGKLELVLERERVRLLRGADELGGAPAPRAGKIESAIYLPEGNVVVWRWGRGAREGCASFDPAGVQLIPLRP